MRCHFRAYVCDESPMGVYEEQIQQKIFYASSEPPLQPVTQYTTIDV